jgi:ABC-type Na+ efflux pump permease subunit
VTSTIIAANSFAGEKERKTLESLLYTPIKLNELFMAKVLGTFLPSYAVTLFAFVVFSIVAYFGASKYVPGFLFFQPRWLVLLFLVCPALIFLGLTFTVWVSARSSSFQEAQQLGGLIVLPMIGLLLGQFSGFFLLDIPQLIGLGLFLIVVDLILVSRVARTFTYENLLQN